MNSFRKLKKKTLTVFIVLFIIGTALSAHAELHLTQEEIDYIARKSVIKAVSIDGGAPLHYIDSRGEVNGIAVRVLEKIADMTGIVFEYKLYDSIDEVSKNDFDVLFGITPQYLLPGMVLSKPYLKSESILFINSSLDSSQLEGKKYASIKGGSLPEGIKEENTIYFNNREDTLDAVEKGKADYGYGNAYSLAYYLLQNNYENIVTIPKGKEPREYSMGLRKDDTMLLSIIDKSIEAISEVQMHTLILDVASQIDRKLTYSMIIHTYGKQIFAIIFIVMALLLFSVIVNVKTNDRLRLQNKRYELLSNISNEYLFEYYIKTNELELSGESAELFGEPGISDEIENQLKKFLANKSFEKGHSVLKLFFADGNIGMFKVISSNIYDERGFQYSIIGKLIDVSKEIAEKEKLVIKSQLDGLTGLYNAVTTRDLIIENIINKDKHIIDSFIIIDCDNFKNINDTYGHLIGDEVLEGIANSLTKVFRETDIVGRIGGDEFCVYLKNVSSSNFIKTKYMQLRETIKRRLPDYDISISAGAAFIDDEQTYEDIFKKAEDALYQAKRNGKAQVVVYDALYKGTT